VPGCVYPPPPTPLLPGPPPTTSILCAGKEGKHSAGEPHGSEARKACSENGDRRPPKQTKPNQGPYRQEPGNATSQAPPAALRGPGDGHPQNLPAASDNKTLKSGARPPVQDFRLADPRYPQFHPRGVTPEDKASKNEAPTNEVPRDKTVLDKAARRQDAKDTAPHPSCPEEGRTESPARLARPRDQHPQASAETEGVGKEAGSLQEVMARKLEGTNPHPTAILDSGGSEKAARPMRNPRKRDSKEPSSHRQAPTASDAPRQEPRAAQDSLRKECTDSSSHSQAPSEADIPPGEAKLGQDVRRQEPRDQSSHFRAHSEADVPRREANPVQDSRQEARSYDSQQAYYQGGSAQPRYNHAPASRRETEYQEQVCFLRYRVGL